MKYDDTKLIPSASFSNLLNDFQKSDDPNNQAFVGAFLALVAAWNRGEAEQFVTLTKAAVVGQLLIETQPSLN